MPNDTPTVEQVPPLDKMETIARNSPHPIAEAVDRLVHRARDIKVAARQFIGMAHELRRRRFQEIADSIEKHLPLLEDADPQKRVVAQEELQTAVTQLGRHQKSKVPEVVEWGLFLGLFSAFDAFTGDLMRALYAQKPELFNGLDKAIPFKDLLRAESIDDLKRQVLDDDIETLRRKSYAEQFAFLENRFSVKLTAFTNWPAFVERSQRRNLITHCDGLVTEQYLRVCREAGVEEKELPSIGARVKLGPDYFFATCELIIEIGIKIGQTLWRKTLPDEIALADRHLMAALYNALDNGIWARAKMVGSYALSLRNIASDLDRKIITINYAQALKRDGDFAEAKRIMDSVDWTAAINEFKLARAVILEEYDQAEELMLKIGSGGDMLKESGYHSWPLFIEFRETVQFSRAYEQVFGYPFTTKLIEEANEASKAATAGAAAEPLPEVVLDAPAVPTGDAIGDRGASSNSPRTE